VKLTAVNNWTKLKGVSSLQEGVWRYVGYGGLKPDNVQNFAIINFAKFVNISQCFVMTRNFLSKLSETDSSKVNAITFNKHSKF
jgi:hypothetical protein